VAGSGIFFCVCRRGMFFLVVTYLGVKVLGKSASFYGLLCRNCRSDKKDADRNFYKEGFIKGILDN